MPTITAEEDQAMVQEDAELTAVVQAWRQSLGPEDQALFASRFEDAKSFPQAAQSLGWSEIRVRKQDTALRTRLLATLRQHGFLQKAKVSIGQSLLVRKDKQKP
jgi:DNA-directed RNA polymerase specialized sigma subunit